MYLEMDTQEHTQPFDPVLFAVLRSRMDAIASEMEKTLLVTGRNPIVYSAKDFSCALLSAEGEVTSMVECLPIHAVTLSPALQAIIAAFDDIEEGDLFAMNSPYHGNSHVGDLCMFAPCFYDRRLICWIVAKCHTIDSGAYLPTNLDPLSKDIYEEGLHLPPVRFYRKYTELKDVTGIWLTNVRYPKQYRGDFLAQVGAVRLGERRATEVCQKYGDHTVTRFLQEYLDYSDRRMTEEIRSLPSGTWSDEALSEKYAGMLPDGALLKLAMRIDPRAATITFDLSDMPDQVAGGINLSESCSRGSCVIGTMACLDPTLPRNDGVYRHIKVIQREGSIAGKPQWPASTSLATVGISDEICNLVFRLWEQVRPGMGHGGTCYAPGVHAVASGTDFRRNHAAFGHSYFLAACSGGGGSKGVDGYAYMAANAAMGGNHTESIEVHELKVPDIIWENRIIPDSGGAGQWRGGVASTQLVQPRKTQLTIIPWGTGHTSAPHGISGGEPGRLADHWIIDFATGEKVEHLANLGRYVCKEDQAWYGWRNGGGGYGDPLKRDPERVKDDARDGFISLEAARTTYGVVLDTEPELFAVDYPATERLRRELASKRGQEGVGS